MDRSIEEEAFARVLATDSENVRREKAVKREEWLQRVRKCKSAIVYRIAESEGYATEGVSTERFGQPDFLVTEAVDDEDERR